MFHTGPHLLGELGLYVSQQQNHHVMEEQQVIQLLV